MTKNILFQGVTSDDHLKAVEHLLSIPDPVRIIISTAFMNESGFRLISDVLAPTSPLTTIFVGIRNGITSAQGLNAAVGSGCATYAVDTGSRHVIFHPKIYFAKSQTSARLILGSANLTTGGLNRNIEASVSMEMNLAVAEDASFVAELEEKLDSMVTSYPKHVFQVPDVDMVAALLASGRLVDESIAPAPIPVASSSNRDLDDIPKMNLKTSQVKKTKVAAIAQPNTPQVAAGDANLPVAPVRDELELVWESRPLTRRYLTIPTASSTHATGSMLFAKGNLDEIDQRHYFRDEVFADLDWEFDEAAGKEHMERANADFQLVIRDVNYGKFTLRLSHNSKTDTKSYQQNNSMTQLHWGPARQLIARDDLLGRTLYLFRDELDRKSFLIEID